MYMGLFAVIFLPLISPQWTLVQSNIQISDQTAGLALLDIFGYGMLSQIVWLLLLY